MDFQEFVLRVRRRTYATSPPVRTHNGVLDSIRNLSSHADIRPRTDNWVTPDLIMDPGSDSLLFVGCTPYLDVVFHDLRADMLENPRASMRLLNAMGTRPRLLESERCCGHDAYWLGDERTFERLAIENVEAIERTGVKEVITFCPECLYTLRELYPKRVGRASFDVISVTEKMAKAIEEGTLISFVDHEENITSSRTHAVRANIWVSLMSLVPSSIDWAV